MFSNPWDIIFYRDVQILYLNPEDDQYYKYFKSTTQIAYITKGIVGYVFKSKSHLYCHSTFNNDYFNPILDVDTSLPLITFPIKEKTNDMILAILQIEYPISKVTIGDTIEHKIDSLDLDIICLYSVNMASSLSRLRLK